MNFRVLVTPVKSGWFFHLHHKLYTVIPKFIYIYNIQFMCKNTRWEASYPRIGASPLLESHCPPAAPNSSSSSSSTRALNWSLFLNSFPFFLSRCADPLNSSGWRRSCSSRARHWSSWRLEAVFCDFDFLSSASFNSSFSFNFLFFAFLSSSISDSLELVLLLRLLELIDSLLLLE